MSDVKIQMEPPAPDGVEIFEHVPLAEIDLMGAALAPSVVAMIEELLAPLADVATHTDITLRRVSIQHLKKPKRG